MIIEGSRGIDMTKVSIQKIDNLIRQLNKIYSRIPTMECKKGCHECCGPIEWSYIEDINMKRWMMKRGIQIRSWGGDMCQYLGKKGCMIYPVRPLICRVYGVSDMETIECPVMGKIENPLIFSDFQLMESEIYLLSEKAKDILGIKDRKITKKYRSDMRHVIAKKVIKK